MTRSGAVVVVALYATLVLIPLLVDDPLWAGPIIGSGRMLFAVLIPLLVDDPLWAVLVKPFGISVLSLNPSFSG